MSDGIKHKREEAMAAANEIIKFIAPACTRIEIAGSLRREKLEVGDIEICAIPNYCEDLFGDKFYSAAIVGGRLRELGFDMDKDGENYKKFYFIRYQIWVDLFLTTPEQWGLIYLIRTGSADFSRLMVTSKQKGGYMPSNYKVSGGRVWSGESKVLATPEESDIFRLWNMKYIEPKMRTS